MVARQTKPPGDIPGIRSLLRMHTCHPDRLKAADVRLGDAAEQSLPNGQFLRRTWQASAARTTDIGADPFCSTFLPLGWSQMMFLS
jgi:hypothetical protein